MASFKDCLTTGGEALFAKMAAGGKVKFTRMALGDGTMMEDTTEKDMTDIIHQVMSLDIASVAKSKDNTVTVRSVFNNTEVEKSFYFREKAVYASVDGEDEVLVFYANNGSKAEYIEAGSTHLVEKILRTIIAFSESDNINIIVENSEMPLVEDGDVYVSYGGDKIKISNEPAIVIMHQYVGIPERKVESLYLQLGKIRGLTILLFKKFYRNLIEIKASDVDKSGVKINVNQNGSVTLNGTATGDVRFQLNAELGLVVPSGNYQLNGCPDSGSESTYYLQLCDNTHGTEYIDSGSGVNIEFTEEADCTCNICLKSGAVCNDLTFWPCITDKRTIKEDVDTLFAVPADSMTENSEDEGNYRCTMTNLCMIDSDNTDRVVGNIYAVNPVIAD